MEAFRLVVEDVIQIAGSGIAAFGKVTHGTLQVQQRVAVFDNTSEMKKVFSTMVTRIVFDRDKIVDKLSTDDMGLVFLRGIKREQLGRNFQITEEGGRPIAVPKPPRVDFNSPFFGLWKGDPDKPLGLALQGGGVKGAFTVGALTLLAEVGFLTRPRMDHIASASTGSLTAVLLGEAKGTVTAQKARNEYFNLRSSDQMFTIRSEVEALLKRSPLLEAPIKGILEGNTSDIDFGDLLFEDLVDSRTIGYAIGGLATGGLLLGALGALVGLFQNADETKDAAKALLQVKHSIAKLDPVRERLRAVVDMKAIERNGITLRLCVVSANTGAIAYITEKGMLLYPDAVEAKEGLDWSTLQSCRIQRIGKVERNDNDLQKLIVEGALTSGAFPAMFEPMEIEFVRDGKIETELFFDGGIRENQPLEILAGQGAKEIIAVYNSSLVTSVASHRKRENVTWPALASRAIDLTFEEVSRTDAAFGTALNRSNLGNESPEPKIVHIAPNVGTIGLTEIHPPKIRATVWYGYMRAHDELSIAQRDPGSSMKMIIRDGSDDVYTALREVHVLAGKIIKNSAYFNKNEKEWVFFEDLKDTVNTISGIAFNNSLFIKYVETKIKLLERTANRFKQRGKVSMPFDHKAEFLTRDFYSGWQELEDAVQTIKGKTGIKIDILTLLRKSSPDALQMLSMSGPGSDLKVFRKEKESDSSRKKRKELSELINETAFLLK